MTYLQKKYIKHGRGMLKKKHKFITRLVRFINVWDKKRGNIILFKRLPNSAKKKRRGGMIV